LKTILLVFLGSWLERPYIGQLIAGPI
jgi:hypothetical protein